MPDQKHSSNEDLVKDIVDTAMNSMNFDRLSQNINSTIQSVFEELNINTNISDHIRGQGFGGTAQTSTSARMNAAGMKAAAAPREIPIAVKNPHGSLSGIVFTALGATFTAIFGLSEFVVITLGIALNAFAKAGLITAVILLPFLLLSIFVLVHGIKTNGRIKRFNKYIKQIGQRKYCQISELASVTGKTNKYTAEDLQGMIDRNFFTNAHIDTLKTTLMLDEETYSQYLKSVEQYQQRVMDDDEKENAEGNSELAQALEEGDRYIRQIHDANEAIPSEAFTEKLDRMEELIRKIFDVIRQKPDQLHKLRKFMKYYMPTTIKLLQAYQELDSQPAGGENIERSKKEIEDTVDTINYAYQKLLDSFFEASAMDISSDISVLESMFAQEGLSRDPFENVSSGGTAASAAAAEDSDTEGKAIKQTDGGNDQ